MSILKSKNPFAKLDATLSPESIRLIVASFGNVADVLLKLWSGLTQPERDTIMSSAEDIGTKLVMGAIGSAMTGDMETVANKLKATLSKSAALTTIFEALKNRAP